MKLIQAPRASAILYNLLVGRADSRPWLLPANICPIVPITFLKAQVPFEFVDISQILRLVVCPHLWGIIHAAGSFLRDQKPQP
jgi:hypothetical protein